MKTWGYKVGDYLLYSPDFQNLFHKSFVFYALTIYSRVYNVNGHKHLKAFFNHMITLEWRVHYTTMQHIQSASIMSDLLLDNKKKKKKHLNWQLLLHGMMR